VTGTTKFTKIHTKIAKKEFMVPVPRTADGGTPTREPQNGKQPRSSQGTQENLGEVSGLCGCFPGLYNLSARPHV
jgi:hypothetical protein